LHDGTYLSLSADLRSRRPRGEAFEELGTDAEAPVCVELAPAKETLLLAKARLVRAQCRKAIPVLPPTDEGFLVARAVSQEKGKVGMSVCSPAQALLASRAGATLVVIPGRVVSKAGQDALELAINCQKALKGSKQSGQILLSGPSPSQITAAAAQRLDGVIADRATLKGLGEHHLSSALVSALAASAERLANE